MLFGPVGNGLLQIDEQLRQTFLGAIVRIEIGVAASNQIATLASLRILNRFVHGTRGAHDEKSFFGVFACQSCIGHVLEKLVECDRGEKSKRHQGKK